MLLTVVQVLTENRHPRPALPVAILGVLMPIATAVILAKLAQVVTRWLDESRGDRPPRRSGVRRGRRWRWRRAAWRDGAPGSATA